MSKAVVVTGASSFLGSHLARGFSLAGYSVVATTYRPRHLKSRLELQRLEWISGESVFAETLDVADGGAIERLLDKYRPRLWIHHAGYTVGYQSPEYDQEVGRRVNIRPLAGLYAALRRFNCEGVIVTGSSMEYSDSPLACAETSVCEGVSAYGRMKLEQTLEALRLSSKYEVPTRVARIFIPFGPFEDPERVLPAVTTALSQGKAVDLSPGLQVRDFLHVDDVVRGYLCLATDMSRGGAEVYNVCSGVPSRLRDILITVAQELGVSADLLRFGAVPMRAGEPMVQYGLCDKLLSIGWRPTPLQESLKRYCGSFRPTRGGTGAPRPTRAGYESTKFTN